MAFLNYSSLYVNRLLCSSPRSVKLVPGIVKNAFCTSNLKYTPPKLYTRRITFNSDPLWTSSSRQYSAGKSGSQEETGEKSTPANPQSQEETEEQTRAKAWKKMKLSFIITGSTLGAAFCYTFYAFGSPDRDEDDKVLEDEFSSMPILQQWCMRYYHKIRYYKKVIQEPSQEKLLPDPLQYPYIQPPYTLVIELTDVLVHPDWTYQTGWRFKKRPNVDAFLQQIGAPIFEVVVFTSEQAFSMVPIVNQLNKNGLIAYSLFRDSTDFRAGHHLKNLDWLNRDLSKVIVVDWDGKSVGLHPDNALIIPRWRGDDDDQTLSELAAFLRTIAFNKVDDVREVLSYYRQFEDPLAKFRENQQILLEQMAEQERLEQAKKERPPLTQRFAKSYAAR